MSGETMDGGMGGSVSGGGIFGRLRSAFLRMGVLSLLWWLLTEGEVDSWPVAVPVVGLAALASLKLLPPVTCSLWGLVCFVPFFLWRSVSGGVDVARRAVHPRLPLSPGLYRHVWRLPAGMPRVFMANVVSLLPGTLCVELGSDELGIHMLDERGDFQAELDELERRVAAVFGVSCNELGRW